MIDAQNELTMEERQQLRRDLDGVASPVEEAPDMITQKLKEMETQLQRLRGGKSRHLQRSAIDLAEARSAVYTRNLRFRLKFLRAERFHPEKAAARMIRYFDWKLELFGEAKLCKDITIEDLDRHDIDMLKKGYIQRLPARDRSGRAVIVTIALGQKYKSPASLARQYFYMLGTDDETERNGLVSILLNIREYSFEAEASMVVYRAGRDSAIRWAALHKYFDKASEGVSRMNVLLDAGLTVFSPELTARTKRHYGSYDNWMKEINTLGIPCHLVPLTEGHKVKTKNHFEYLSMRQMEEELAAAHQGAHVPTTILPTNRDVLLGKGKPIQESAGNQRLAIIIDGYVEQYLKLSKSGKTALAAEMVQKVKDAQGRFLSKDLGIWVEVAPEVARDKVSHMFRHQRHRGNSTSSGRDDSTAVSAQTLASGVRVGCSFDTIDMRECKRIKL